MDGPTPGGAQNPGQQGAAPLVQTVRVSMPIKPPPGFKGPPGLDTVALNPSARVFQPTDDSPRGSNSGSASKAERRNKAPAESYYEPGFDYSTAVHNASHVQAQLQHQQHTTYYPLPVSAGVTTTTSATTSAAGATYADTTPSVTSAPSAAVPAAVSASPLPVTQPMPYGSPQPVPYSVPQSDYRGRRGNSNSNNNMSGSEVDMYGHPHTANGHGMGMYRGHGQQSGVPMQMQAGYMNVPVYDSSIYMNDHSHMQVQGMAGGVPMYMADGSLWYPTISQNMQQSSMQNMHGVVPGIPADGTTGGTVYYPLPPQPSTTD